MLTVVLHMRRVGPHVVPSDWKTSVGNGDFVSAITQVRGTRLQHQLDTEETKLHTVIPDARWVNCCKVGTWVESSWLAGESYLVFWIWSSV